MLDTGLWGLPILFDGRIDLQKPPGYYWAVAAIGWLNGGVVDGWVTRLPSALAGFLCVMLMYGFVRAERRPTAALLAALVLTSANHFTGIARTARIDIPLACGVTAALVAFYRGCKPAASVGWHILAAGATGMAILLKGPVALALIGPPALAWFLIERPRLAVLPCLLGSVIVALVALPWFLWANSATSGELVRVFFWHHTIERYTGASPLLASHPWWYYGPRFAIDFLPWTPPLAALVIWSVRSGHWRTDPHFRFAFIAFAAMVLVMSTAHFKRADYLLPAFPFASLAVGCGGEAWYLSRANQRTLGLARYALGSVLAVVVIGWVVMTTLVEPAADAKEEKRRFAEAIRAEAPAPQTILQFRMESHLLSFHLGRPVHTLVEWGELNELLAEPGPHFVLMPPEYVYPTREIVKTRQLRIVTRLEDHTTARPPRPLVFLRTLD
jgi:4-amino-4-deoxy-L-arabinose transferase-like glycosyltransferase